MICLFQDTDVIVWDVINESGLYRLRGHKDAVTQVLFLKEKNLLVTRWARLSVVINQESSRGFACNLDILGATAVCIFFLDSWYFRPTSILEYGFVMSTYFLSPVPEVELKWLSWKTAFGKGFNLLVNIAA